MVFSAHSYLSIVNELGIKRSFRQSNRPPHSPPPLVLSGITPKYKAGEST